MNKSGQGVTAHDLHGWLALADAKRPKAPTVADSILAPMVQSLSASATRSGMLITLVMDNGQQITLNLNAVLGAELVKATAAAGYHMKWLERDGTPKANR